MNVFLKKWIHVLGILSIPIQGLIYVWIGKSIGPDVFHNYYWLDTQIPFIRWFIFPYISWMPLLYISFLYLAIVNRRVYFRTLIMYNSAVMACNLCFWFFATYVPRPIVESTDIAGYLVNFIYQSDAPYNCFPSIHCLTSYLLLMILKRDVVLPSYLRIFFKILLWLIIASTVFIKQHSILDVFGGILIAEIAYRAVHYVSAQYIKREKQVTESI
ncbi:membrane-associated phospholipid phosphatase [Paenibacillus castaneae]|uniref:phosphatase PAP2 family protein n=1 Tax=Paenibacillus castaneae TaxID=474957 RepID=UPI000C9BC2C8|nr:phosphatase PAP2 family protein [Paenibacillus castaneae]NIK78275.1 membrane-associated phospholipid phosphatase [Paenibacillus castaneae]